MEPNEVMANNEEVIETATEEIAKVSSGCGFKVVAGFGLGILAGMAICKLAKPIIAKIKAQKTTAKSLIDVEAEKQEIEADDETEEPEE